MQWIVTIDIPFWITALEKGEKEWDDLLALLDAVLDENIQLLYRNEIIGLAQEMPDNSWLLYSKLSKISTIGYDTNQKAIYIKSHPDLTKGISKQNVKTEICNQVAFLYNRTGALPRAMMSTDRLTVKDVVLSKDNKNERRMYVCGVKSNDIQQRIKSFFPVLNQGKHFQFERYLGKGKVASKFSAYDKNNKKPAEDLLRTAFLHYSGEQLPAEELWAKDEINGCYVRFMHSGNNEYHGYDEKDFT